MACWPSCAKIPPRWVLTTEPGWLRPDWPAPPGIRAAVSTRLVSGASLPPFEHFNLGGRCGDDPAAVVANRASLIERAGLPAEPFWLRQVHGITVARTDEVEPEADAAIGRPGEVLAILTADCLPVLFCSEDGCRIGAAHAGWRGLAGGVLEATVAALGPGLMAWLGPCIGAASYEVGEEVRAAFVDPNPAAARAFAPTRPGHWLCDLARLARLRLEAAGLRNVSGGGFDTFADARFYSYRRDAGRSGRFATLIW
jgi:YfiH family protein